MIKIIQLMIILSRFNLTRRIAMTEKENKPTPEERLTQLKETMSTLSDQLSFIEIETTKLESDEYSKEHGGSLIDQFNQLTEKTNKVFLKLSYYIRKFKKTLSQQEKQDLLSMRDTLVEKQNGLREFFIKKMLLSLHGKIENLRISLSSAEFSIYGVHVIWHKSLAALESSNNQMKQCLDKLDALAKEIKIISEETVQIDRKTLSPALQKLFDFIVIHHEKNQKIIENLYRTANKKLISAYAIHRLYAKYSKAEESEAKKSELDKLELDKLELDKLERNEPLSRYGYGL